MTTYVPIVSDVQAPLHDQRATSAVASFLADRDWDSVSVGDVADMTQVGKWVRGKATEFDGLLSKHRDIAHQLIKDLRIKHLSRSNHDERVEKYVSTIAPAFSGLPELRTENFLRLGDAGCVYHREPYSIAPGWLLMHGDEGPLVKAPGGTALGLARRTGRSVACGHTHKMGLSHEHSFYSGRLVAPLFGLEVGHLMNMRKAQYLKAGYGNWQQAIGMLVVEGQTVFPYLIPIVNGKLHWDGKTYRG